MKRTWTKIAVLALALALFFAGDRRYARAGTNILPSAPSIVAMLKSVTSAQDSAVWLNSSYLTHLLVVQTTNTPSQVNISLEGSMDNSTWIVLASSTSTASPTVLTAAGFYSYLRVHLQTLTGTGATLTAYYSGAPVGGDVGVAGTVTIQGGDTGATPVATADQSNFGVAFGAPNCTFSYTANNSCDVGNTTASGTGCAITNTSPCSFSSNAWQRLTCTTDVGYQINQTATSITYGASLSAKTTERFLWPTGANSYHLEVISTTSGSCDIEQLQ